ncbi:unnamed protein product, partial [Aphanomyces euteiches]
MGDQVLNWPNSGGYDISDKFQWLPSPVKVDKEGKASFRPYIKARCRARQSIRQCQSSAGRTDETLPEEPRTDEFKRQFWDFVNNFSDDDVVLNIPQVPNIPDQSGRVAIVTGGTAGIGYESVLALARKGCHVIFTARSTARGEETLAKIKSVLEPASFQ